MQKLLHQNHCNFWMKRQIAQWFQIPKSWPKVEMSLFWKNIRYLWVFGVADFKYDIGFDIIKMAEKLH